MAVKKALLWCAVNQILHLVKLINNDTQWFECETAAEQDDSGLETKTACC